MQKKNKKRYIFIKLTLVLTICVIFAGAGFIADESYFRMIEGFIMQMQESAEHKPRVEQTYETNYMAQEYEADFLLLVNKQHMLDRDYVPEDLLNLSDFVPATKSAIYFNSQAVSDYVAMINEMDEYGLRDLYAVSGYRTYYQQDSLYRERVGSMSS